VVLRRRVVVFLVVLGADFFGAANFAFFGATLSVSVFATVSIIAGGDSTWGVISFAIFAGATVVVAGAGTDLTGSGAGEAGDTTTGVAASAVGGATVVLMLFNILIRGCRLCFLANFLVDDSILLFFPIWNSYVLSSTVNSNRGCKNLKKLRAVFLGRSPFSIKTPQPKREGGKL